MIHESYDPDRTTIELKLDDEILAQSTVQEKDAGLAKTGPKLGQKVEHRLANLTAAARQVFKAYCEDTTLTQRGMSTKLGLSRTTIGVATAALLQEGLLRRIGPKKGGHWEIVKPQPQTGGNGS